jgi:hypothetical protein
MSWDLLSAMLVKLTKVHRVNFDQWVMGAGRYILSPSLDTLSGFWTSSQDQAIVDTQSQSPKVAHLAIVICPCIGSHFFLFLCLFSLNSAFLGVHFLMNFCT